MNAVIFDMDGTLFDTERVYQGIWRQLGREFDLPVSDAFLCDLAGCDWASARPVFARYFPADFPLEAVKARQHLLIIQRQQQGMPLKKGFHEILRFLHAHHVPMGIATSSMPDIVKTNLEHAQARHYFQTIVTAMSRMASRRRTSISAPLPACIRRLRNASSWKIRPAGFAPPMRPAP